MFHSICRTALVAGVFGVSVSAQAPDATGVESRILLRYEVFDPLVEAPQVPTTLQSGGADRLWIVQFDGRPTQTGRDAVAESGGEIHGYLPDNAYVVRMTADAAPHVQSIESVRWVGRYHAIYRLEPELIAEHLAGAEVPARRYHMVVVDKHNDKPALAAAITAMGGTIDSPEPGSILFTVTLTGDQLLQAARLDQVLWIDRWTAPEQDVDNARIQGGANHVETQGGWTGAGLNAHIYEGIDPAHPAYSGPVTNVLSGGASSGHGTNTAGIVFGDGTGNSQFRGFAPDVGKFYTNFGSVSTSRYNVVAELVNNRDVSHTTASWGGGRTFFYTSVSADTDDIIFDHDIVWTQSQSNAGNQDSRPQAWAKNIFSTGGVRHGDNSDPFDDTWSSSGSTGPAADGRIKPTMAAYYDSIGTTSSGGGYTTGFGGTSGATPIICGHNLLAIDMYTDEVTPGVNMFGVSLRNPGGSKHSNRPHFTTLKCLQVASARKYFFNSSSTDNRREHVGWGFPNLQTMYDNRNNTFIVDETDVLTQGNSTRWNITVGASEPELRIVMHHAEPAGNPAASLHRVNDLSLRVTAPNGTIYWGNNGLEQGNLSVAGGTEDNINPIECVFLENPQAGVWFVDVIATLVAQDSHVETPAVDADYGLVVAMGPSAQPPVLATFEQYGQGCPGSVPAPFCAELNGNGGSLSNSTNNLEYRYRVVNTGSTQVTSFDIFTNTTGGTINRPAHIYADSGGSPALTPIASTTITVGPGAAFYTATFGSPVAVTGTFYIGVDSSSGDVRINNLTSGTLGTGFFRTPPSGGWTQSSLVQRPSWRVTCTGSQQLATPELGNNGLPILNTSYDITLSDAVASSAAIIMTGFSDSIFNGTPLPTPLPNAPGCLVYAAPEVTLFLTTSGSGTASQSFAVPNDAGFIGVALHHQWAILDAVNALGIVVSDAGRASVGN